MFPFTAYIPKKPGKHPSFLLIAPHDPDAIYERVRGKSWAPWLRLGGLALVFLLCVAALASQSYNPFIYFRF